MPNFKYVANMHGDEPCGRQLLLKLAEWLCRNRKTNPKAKTILNGMHLFLLPSMNPDGYEARSRENSHEIDLNRDFPDRFDVEESSALRPRGNEQPETLLLMKWIENGFFVGSGNLHEGAVVANYPWDADTRGGGRYAACPDDATFIYLAKIYVKSHLTMNASEEFKDGITNGNAWYTVFGSMQDYNYIMGNCMELTLELSQEKTPNKMELEMLWKENKDAFLDFAITAALKGFRGVVYAEGEVPLAAKISIQGIDKDYYTRPEFGDFYRPLSPGEYNITVSAEDYESVTTSVVISDKIIGNPFRFELSRTHSRPIRLKTVPMGSAPHVRTSSRWAPPTMVVLLLSVFLVIGVIRVNRLSSTRSPLM